MKGIYMLVANCGWYMPNSKFEFESESKYSYNYPFSIPDYTTSLEIYNFKTNRCCEVPRYCDVILFDSIRIPRFIPTKKNL